MQLHKCGTLPAPAVWCKPGVNSLVTEKSCYRVRPGCLGPVGLELEEEEVEEEEEEGGGSTSPAPPVDSSACRPPAP